MKTSKLEQLEKKTNCMGGLFSLGKKGVEDIRGTKDGKIEFFDYNGSTMCAINSCCGQRAVYPLEDTQFEAPAEYVVMDLDGTTIISEEFWIDIIRQTVSQIVGREVEFSLEDLPYVSGHTTQEHLDYALQKYGNGRKSNDIEVYHDISRRELDAALSGKNKNMQPVEGLRELLLAMKERGVKIGLVSSGLFYKAIPEIESVFASMDLGDPKSFYDGIIMGGVEKGINHYSTIGELAAKPHPWLYKELVHIGLKCTDNSKVIVIEDSASGVVSARLAGYSVIGMNSGNVRASGMAPLCYTMVDSLKEVENIIFKGVKS